MELDASHKAKFDCNCHIDSHGQRGPGRTVCQAECSLNVINTDGHVAYSGAKFGDLFLQREMLKNLIELFFEMDKVERVSAMLITRNSDRTPSINDAKHLEPKFMSHLSPAPEEVELLLRNARLRDELEPYVDESVALVSFRQMNLREENDFLESMLAWERAPALPIGRWSNPPLVIPSPERPRRRCSSRVAVRYH